MNNVIQYLCVLKTIQVARKKWTRGKEKGKNVGLNLLQPLHCYCGQCNTLSYRNQGSEPAKLDLVRKSKNCIDLICSSGSTSKIPPRHIITETKKKIEILTMVHMKN